MRENLDAIAPVLPHALQLIAGDMSTSCSGHPVDAPTLRPMAQRTLAHNVAAARQRLAAESGAVVKDWGGRLPVALVYPNSYYLGMSNLGLQTIYGLLNRRADIVCERAFYDPPHKSERGDDPSLGPVTIESQRPLADFPVVAYTLTYEIDYYHVVRSLQAAQI